MPISCLVIALFIVLGSSAVGLGGKLMVLSSLPVYVVHSPSVQHKKLVDPGLSSCAATTPAVSTSFLLRHRSEECPDACGYRHG